MQRRTALNVASIVCSVIVLLVALEVTYQVRERRQTVSAPRGLFRLDPVFLLEIKPDLRRHEIAVNDGKVRFKVTTTSGSYRGRTDYPVERAPKVLRIMTDGSSYTFGWNVEDDRTWPALLERELNAAKLFEERVEVINIGCPNIGGRVARYAHRFRRYKPDLLILEAMPRRPRPLQELEPDRPAGINPWFIDAKGIAHLHATTNPLLRALSERSVAFRHVLHRVRSSGGGESSASFNKTQEQAQYEAQSDACLNYFREYQAQLTSDQALLLALIRPARSVASAPEIRLVPKLEALGISALTTANEIRFSPEHRGWDGHWSEAGNTIAARLVRDLIQKNAKAIRGALARRREAGLIP